MELRPILSALLRNKTAPLLVALQVAISLAILANAIYIVNLRLESASRPSGVAEEHDVFSISTFTIQKQSHQEVLAQRQRNLDALAAIPGVVSVAWTSQMPLSRSGSNSSFTLDRKQTQRSAVVSTYYTYGPFVKTMGLKLLEGRDFTADDVVEFDPDVDDSSKKYAKSIILTKPLADQFFPGVASAIGKTVYNGFGKDAIELRVIGVVERLQSTGASIRPDGEFSGIIPLQTSAPFSKFAVRAEPGQRDRVMTEAEAVLRKISPVPAIFRGRAVDEDRTNRYRNEKALAWMLIAVCALLLLVTASGIVGMTTLRVAQRRKLIGVRRALGARRRDIVRHFIAENFMITSGGVLAGLVFAVFLNQLLVSQLELSKLPVTYLINGAALLWLLGLVAVYGPAWRAAGISPAIATRSA